MNRNVLAIALILVVLATLACNLSSTPAETTPTPSGEAAGGVTPTPTPAPDITTQGGCTLNAAFVADVTVPDNTEFPSGTAFTKTWRLRNTGTCTWEAGTLLVFVSGDAMGGPASVPV
ncbi:MAG TPA: hypothetical protein ENK08_06195, partial [Chloroflexi bacterium]|nr:hypothetical protein [Chloroflexota bacterium]